jgi:hypothetical protein
VFCLFISKLVAVLTKEDKDWRKNTMVLMDGAKYQTSDESQKYMQALGLKVCITAPYSFTTSPIELAFAHFKSVNINPENLKTGKK